MERRIQMRLRTENAEDRQFLEWLDQTHQDKHIPLRALLVPLMLKGIEAEKRGQAASREDTAPQRTQEKWPRQAQGAINGAGVRHDTVARIEPKRAEPQEIEEFPLDKLSFE